jgi:Peptidase C13 family
MTIRILLFLLLAAGIALFREDVAAQQVSGVSVVSNAPPPRIQWRAIAVAGDDSAPVFDNAVEEIAEILAVHAVHPINRLTSDPMVANPHRPIATAQSIADALDAQPPKPGQGCLVFITSHGSRNGVLLRDDETNRRLLGPTALEGILDRGCGTAPTVAIISACFSGVFLDRLAKTPNRIILTAARDDRTSFGCGHEEQFTYFDGCMLKAWPDSQTWQALFQATQACVQRKEDALHFQHSEPQAYFGAAVKDLGLP